MQTLHLQHPERLWMAAIWLGLIVILLLWGYVKSPLNGWRRWAAMGCKALAAVLLAACLLDPVQVTESPKKGANEVIVLLDNSASLAIAEKTGGMTRGEEMKASLSGTGKQWAPWLEQLRSTFRVRLQAVDERVHGVGDASELDFTGRQSALASAVKAAIKTLIDGGYAGHVLPINPKEREILGFACYPDLASALRRRR